MIKFDTTCGLTKKEIAIIRYNIKKDLRMRIPLLPEKVEIKLFFEGRGAWTYSWGLRELPESAPVKRLYVEVTAKLKKEFHYLEQPRHHRFLCKVQVGPSIYHPKLSIREEDAEQINPTAPEHVRGKRHNQGLVG